MIDLQEIKYSFIVPIYNTDSKYLKTCLNSILCQKGIFEVLLVDDGSTDENVKKICKEYSNSKVKYYYKENGGVSSARNYGISLASGKYLIFIDADDLIVPQFLEKLDQVTKDYDLLVYKNYRINQKNKIIKKNRNTRFNMGVVWGKVFKRKIIIENAIRFLEKIRYAEDSLFIQSLLPFCSKVEYLDEKLYAYRINNDSVGHRYNLKNAIYFNETLCKIYEIEKNVQDAHRYAVTFLVDYVLPTTVYHKNCLLSKKEKKNKAIEIINNPNFVYGKALKHLDKSKISLTLRFTCFLLKKEKFKLALFFTKIKKMLSSNY